VRLLQNTYAFGDVMAIDLRPRTISRHPKSPVSVQPQRLVDDSTQPRKVFALFAIDVTVCLEGASDFILQFLQLVGILQEK
jgi:hypothetical protein